MAPTRIGLVGSGGIAEAHATSYAQIDDAEVVGVASKEDASEFVSEHAPGAETFDDAATMLDAIDPDVVDVCVPTDVHPDIVETAASSGYDVICEKPIARTLSDARRMASVVEDAGVTFMVGHTLRFSPAYERAKELVENGDVGNPAVIRTSRVGPYPAWCWQNWFADRTRSGGILLDLVIHDFDFLRWTFGEVDRVFARDVAWTDDDSLMEHAVTTLRFADGPVAHVEGSWAQQESRPFSFSLEIAGDDGLIEFDGTNPAFEAYTPDGARTELPTGKSAMQRELEHFLECVRTDAEPAVTIDDAIESARVSLAAIRSAEQGKPVAPADVQEVETWV